MIVKNCGASPSIAQEMGELNEAAQFIRCSIGILSDGIGTESNSCHTAFARQDYIDNQRGYTCPNSMTCEKRCFSLAGRDKTPSLFGPLYGKNPSQLRSLLRWLLN